MDNQNLLKTKSQERLDFYKSHNKIFYQDDIKKWVVIDEELIKLILKNDQFKSLTFNLDLYEKRFSLDLFYVKKLAEFNPLQEYIHPANVLRRDLSQLMASRLDLSLTANKTMIIELVDSEFNSAKTFDVSISFFQKLVADLFSNLTLIPIDINFFKQHPAVTLVHLNSLKHIIALNDWIKEVVCSHKEIDAIYLHLSLLMLGSNTLLGALQESFVQTLLEHKDKKFSQMYWPLGVNKSSAPFTERIVYHDIKILDKNLKKGEIVRLYLEAPFLTSDSKDQKLTDLFFGFGMHQCIGKKLSGEVWQSLTEAFRQINFHGNVLSVKYNDHDVFFDTPLSLEIQLY